MPLYLIDVHWQRRAPEAGRPQTGIECYAIAGRTFSASKGKAIRKFNRHFGLHLAVQGASEKADPADIYQETFQVRDCGSGHNFGVCPVCKQGHGHVLMERGIYSAAI